jgi:hypothetical protein
MTQVTTQPVLFSDEFHKPVSVLFDQPDSSSDGGAILLKSIDAQLSLTERLASCLRDTRQPGKIVHSTVDLLRQRVFGIAAGYPDCNDADALADDPVQKLLLDRDPVDGQSLGSQPTLSRFENAPSSQELFILADELAEVVIDRQRKHRDGKARRITIDMDPTDDPTHGAQQLTFFNGHYGGFCYLPMVGTLQFNDEPEKYLFTIVLRPGNAHCSRGAIGILKRVIAKLRVAFPKTQIRVRLDGGFSSPAILDYLDQEHVEYLVGFAGNLALEARVEPLMRAVRVLSATSGKTETLFADIQYQTKTWSKPRRLIVKAEVVRFPDRPARDNDRYVVTNLTLKPERVYKIYRGRGDMENRIKELHHDLEVDRTSCTDFKANQFRVLLTASAYVLMQELRFRAAATEFAAAQVGTLRLRLFKLGAWVERSIRRIVIHLPLSYPWARSWQAIASAVGATL